LECHKKNMKNKFLIFALTLISLSVYSQKKERLTKQYIDSLINSIEEKNFKEIETNVLSIYKDISDRNKILDDNDFELNLKIENFELKIQNYSEKIDSLLAHSNDINNRLNNLLEKYNSSFNDKILIISETTSLLDRKIDSLKNKTDLFNTNLSNSNSKISEISNQLDLTKSNLNNLSIDFSDKGQKVLIAIVITLFLIFIIYILLNKKWNSEIKIISLKQKEVIEKQVEDSQKLADWLSNKTSKQLLSNSSDTDHSFAKRVADEIVRMSTNLSRMDDSIRGFKQLSASVRKLIQSLSINEYEIVDLLNKPYTSGMNLEANFVFDEKIEKGTQIISRIIKPQINYKGKMIQSAQVEVSQND